VSSVWRRGELVIVVCIEGERCRGPDADGMCAGADLPRTCLTTAALSIVDINMKGSLVRRVAERCLVERPLVGLADDAMVCCVRSRIWTSSSACGTSPPCPPRSCPPSSTTRARPSSCDRGRSACVRACSMHVLVFVA
jgi:hypothetical protein